MFYEIGYVLFFLPIKWLKVCFYIALIGSYVKSELHGFMCLLLEGSKVVDSHAFKARL